MSHGADHASGRATRKLRVGVQGDDVADALQSFQRACLERKAIVLTEQKFVEIKEFAALSLPTHPHSLASIEDPMTMQEKERATIFVGVFCVQIVHALHCKGGQGISILVQRTCL